jgi:hypothetical protein
MLTDTEIKVKGLNILVKELGDVMAEKFISLILKEPFDYTKWQRHLFEEMDIIELSKKAMENKLEVE